MPYQLQDRVADHCVPRAEVQQAASRVGSLASGLCQALLCLAAATLRYTVNRSRAYAVIWWIRLRKALSMAHPKLPDYVLATGVGGAVVMVLITLTVQSLNSTPALAETTPPVTASAQVQGESHQAAAVPVPAPPAQSPPAPEQAPAYPDTLDGWIQEARAILTENGDQVPSAKALKATALAESSGRPQAVNRWDSNARAGTPSIGLAQMIRPTFAAYALPGHREITDPVDNLVASARYCNARYGGMDNMAGARCYGKCWRGY